MINIDLICVGKLKSKIFKELEKNLIKKIKNEYNINIIEIEYEKNLNIQRENEVDKIKKTEGKKILSKIKKNSYIITFEILAKTVKEFYLTDIIKKLDMENITIIIGGSVGLSEEVSNISNKKISISKMTFPHQLMRLVILEQFI